MWGIVRYVVKDLGNGCMSGKDDFVGRENKFLKRFQMFVVQWIKRVDLMCFAK